MLLFLDYFATIVAVSLLSIGVFILKIFGQNLMPMFSRIILLNWFEKKKCTMLGLSGIFLSIAFGLAPGIFNSLIGKVGIEFSWIIIAGLILLILTPIIWLFSRDYPAQFGLKLDGDKSTGKDYPSKSIREAIKLPAFWLFMLTASMTTLISTGIQFHIVDIFREFGYETARAFKFFTPVAIISATSSLLFSWLQDKVSLKYGLLLALSIQVLLLTTLEFGNNRGSYHLLLLLFGCNYGTYTIVMSSPWARLFRGKHLGNIIGCVSIGIAIFNAISPYLMSLAKSKFSTYLVATRGFLALSILLLLLSIFFTKAADMT
jgi:hypothetical protein